METLITDEEFDQLPHLEKIKYYLEHISEYAIRAIEEPNLETFSGSAMYVPSFFDSVDDDVICPYCGKHLGYSCIDHKWIGFCDCTDWQAERNALNRLEQVKKVVQFALDELKNKREERAAQHMRESFVNQQRLVSKALENTYKEIREVITKEYEESR